MARPLRKVAPGSLVEITCRVVQSRLLLRPSSMLNLLVAGVIARAQQRYSVQVCFVVVLGNHIHLACAAEDGQQLSRFVQFLKSNIAREINRVLGRSGTFWERRYSATAIPLVGAKMEERFRYLLSQSAKENLVERIVQGRGSTSGVA